MTVREFADQICRRAREVDPDLIGTGVQRMESDDASGSCAVWCETRGGGYKSRAWTLPDGTACSRRPRHYCIQGHCQKFACSSSEDTQFSARAGDCEWEELQLHASTQSVSTKTSGTWRREAVSPGGGDDAWRAVSGCHFHCVRRGAGLRLVERRHTTTIQLCAPGLDRVNAGCSHRRSAYEYATMLCTQYKDRVRRLSGLGMQISPVLEEPDRPCRVACQDERVAHRFYLVNGHEGWFPMGTACGNNNTSYCVSGKCLEFGEDNTPVSESVFTLPLHSGNKRVRRSVAMGGRREVMTRLQPQQLHSIISSLNLTTNMEHVYYDAMTIPERIEVDFNNPIHISPEDTLIRKMPRPTWD